MLEKDYFMFFNRDRMPVAVFYTYDRKEAIKLFCKLYRKPWLDLVREEDVLVVRECDILPEELDRICGYPESKYEEPYKAITQFDESSLVVIELRPYFIGS